MEGIIMENKTYKVAIKNKNGKEEIFNSIIDYKEALETEYGISAKKGIMLLNTDFEIFDGAIAFII